jgi:hypothetical protein
MTLDTAPASGPDRAVADTRRPDGPVGRTYAAPFAHVWDALLAEIRRRKRWTLVHADEGLGLLTVICRRLLPRGLDDLTVWVSLDENGLTRVDLRSMARSGRSDFGANERRVRDLTKQLDRALGPRARVQA